MDNRSADATRTVDGLLHRLRLRAADLGLQADDDESLFEAVLQHDLQIPAPGIEECQRYYAQHSDALRQGDLIEADHILLAITAATPIDALRAKAQTTVRELLAEPDRFAEMARELSNCPSGQVGGRLGQLTAEQCVPEFWQALTEYGRPGLLPRLVRSRFGLHIVRIGRMVRGTVPPFDAAHALIAQRLQRQSLVRALQLYADDLLQHAASSTQQAAAVSCAAVSSTA